VTGSVTSLGLVVGTRTLTNVLFVLFGGVLADRLSRRGILVASSWFSALTQASLAALVMIHAASMPLMIILSAANGTASAFTLPASWALTPQTVPAGMVRQAVILVRLGTNTAMISGASLGGLLVSLTSPGCGLAVDATTFAIAGCCFTRINPAPPSGAAPDAKPALLTELRQGWSEFTARTWVWLVVVGFCFINPVYIASTQVLGPVVADHTIGRRAWGLVLATQTVGMLAGGLASMTMRAQRQLLVGVVAISTTALVPLALAARPTTPVLCVAAFAAGIALEQFTVAWETSLQQHIAPSRLARVYSYDALGSYMAIPLAQIAVGPVADRVGTGTTLSTGAVIILAATICMTTSRSVRAVRTAQGETVASATRRGDHRSAGTS
jgi:MFS family permease